MDELVEWHYIDYPMAYSYWVIAANKTKFEKEEMIATSKVFLPKGEKAEYHNTRNAEKIEPQT